MTETSRFSYAGLDRTIHEKARLSLLTSLASHPNGLSFGDLKSLCGLTDGNLSRHVRVLSDAGFVSIEKGYEGNRPHTHCKITAEGQKQFLEYIAELERVVRDANAMKAAVAAKTTKSRQPKPA